MGNKRTLGEIELDSLRGSRSKPMSFIMSSRLFIAVILIYMFVTFMG